MAGYFQPRTLEDALQALGSGRFKILAGGTDLFPADTNIRAWGGAGLGHKQSDPLLDISRIEGLDRISQTEETVSIGAGVTWSQIIDANLPDWAEALRLSAREVGGRQIQNQATLAGNLCNASPAADGVPPLIALNAAVQIDSLDGQRSMPVSEFIQGNRETQLRANEMVTAINFTPPDVAARSVFLKLGARSYLVISIASVAVTIAVDTDGMISDIRIAVGACSAVAQRLSMLEARLLGAPLSGAAALIEKGDFANLSPIDDVRGSAGYRLQSAEVLTRRAIVTLARDFGQDIGAAA